MPLKRKDKSAIKWSDYLKSGNRIFIGSNAAVPNALIDDLIANSAGLHDIEAVHILTLSDNVWADRKHQDLFKVNAFFIGGDKIRQAINEAVSYTHLTLPTTPYV